MIENDLLNYDVAEHSKEIEEWVGETVFKVMKKRGVVIGMSGGIDSSVCARICVNALGKERVFGLMMPEIDTEEETNRLGRMVSDHLGIEVITEDLSKTLEVLGCYGRRDEAIRDVVPEYDSGWRSKVILPSILDSDRLNVSHIVAVSTDGERIERRLRHRSYLKVIASSNFKQRTRKMMEYYHADRLNYAVIGTPNKLEYDLGFFVKNGDGSADIKPIAHLYKTQVYQMARYYELPGEILSRVPTTDTFSLPQTQEEFYFSVSHTVLDICLYGKNHGMTPEEIAPIASLEVEQVAHVYRD
ncbi:MAG: NAD(+) synthase, partial [Thermoplasmatota archaeon]